jgi:hypothetical protein
MPRYSVDMVDSTAGAMIDTNKHALQVAAGPSTRVAATLTRPADTTQYAAGDQVANSTSAPVALTFAGVARHNGGSGLIVDAVCVDSANQVAKPNLRLYLFSALPTSQNDNAAWAPTDADMANLIGYVEFYTWEVGNSASGADGNCASFATPTRPIPFVCGATSDDIYGLVVERGTYTPVSAEAFKFSLGIAQD